MLLGDTFDFTLVEHGGRRLDATPAGALVRLERIATAHAGVFAALRRVACAGVALDVVPGNHDLELLSPIVTRRLQAMLTADGGSLTLHPWIIHVPGLAHLEHGQQHHDLNRVPGLLGAGDVDELPLLAGTVYGEHLLALADVLGADVPIERLSARALAATARRRPARLRAAIAPSIGALARLTRCERAARRARPPLERVQRAAHGLPPVTVGALERASATTPASALRRVLARASEPYMVRAARTTHELLAGAGCAVPFYVLAHTHAAEDRSLTQAAGDPRYLNAGTWSRLAPTGARRQCYVELRDNGGAPSAQLLDWPA